MNTSYCTFCGTHGEFSADDDFLCPECYARTNGLAIAKPFAADEDEDAGVKTSFGTMRDFARASNYSHSYYRQSFDARSLIILGRTQQRQGSPSLRCTAEFLACAKRHAADAKRSILRIDQNCELIKGFKYVDFVEFEVDSASITATGYSIGGYWLTFGEEFDFSE